MDRDSVARLRGYAFCMLIVVGALLSVGIVFVYSASSFYAAEKLGNPQFYLKRQIIYALAGLVAFTVGARISLDFFKRSAFLWYFIALGGIALTFLPMATRIHGASRWITIRGLSVQPGELLAPALILYVASFLARKPQAISIFSVRSVGFATMVMSGLLLLLKQPDFGGAFTLGCAVFALLSVAELSLAHIAWMTAIFTPLVAALIIMKPYRLARILAFLHPWGDPRGKGFQLIQSLIAVGSGGLWGRGISLSRQKYFYLPMQHTDFIFPIIAEETGFVGSTLLVVLFMLFLFFGFKILQLLEDRFSFYIVLGGVALISMRAAINLMVATGLLPTKGLGLPFVSYGGTALVANLFMVGLIINSVRTQKMMACLVFLTFAQNYRLLG